MKNRSEKDFSAHNDMIEKYKDHGFKTHGFLSFVKASAYLETINSFSDEIHSISRAFDTIGTKKQTAYMRWAKKRAKQCDPYSEDDSGGPGIDWDGDSYTDFDGFDAWFNREFHCVPDAWALVDGKLVAVEVHDSHKVSMKKLMKLAMIDDMLFQWHGLRLIVVEHDIRSDTKFMHNLDFIFDVMFELGFSSKASKKEQEMMYFPNCHDSKEIYEAVPKFPSISNGVFDSFFGATA